jgi:pimeloyl-ACP methyl ester carboxylesterase
MRASEAEILIIPGLGGSGPDHWQSRWESKLPSARRVVQQDWDRPALTAWRGRIVEEVERAEHPVILVAHSLGVLVAAHSALLARGTNGNKVKGAFMVAPPSQNILSIFDAVDPAFLILPGTASISHRFDCKPRRQIFLLRRQRGFGEIPWRKARRRRLFRSHQQRKRAWPVAGRPDVFRCVAKDAVKAVRPCLK